MAFFTGRENKKALQEGGLRLTLTEPMPLRYGNALDVTKAPILPGEKRVAVVVRVTKLLSGT